MSETVSKQWVKHRLPSWRYWGQRLLPTIELTPLRISATYALVGFFALFVSDVLLVRNLPEPLLSQVQTLKGGLEVMLTAGFILLLTSQRESQLQKQRSSLEQQQEQLQVLHRVLRHNLRNDLNVVDGYLNQIRSQLSTNSINEDCSKVLNRVDEMKRYADKSAQIKQIAIENGELVTYDLSKEISALLDDNSEIANNVKLSTDIQDYIKVEADQMFLDALDELFTNAINHNDTERPIIEVHAFPDEGPSHLVEIHILDNGPGIPLSELEPLKKGEDELHHLSGIGLWFVEWTIRHSKGTLLFEENDPRGTTVILQIPKAPEMLSTTLSPLNGDD